MGGANFGGHIFLLNITDLLGYDLGVFMVGLFFNFGVYLCLYFRLLKVPLGVNLLVYIFLCVWFVSYLFFF